MKKKNKRANPIILRADADIGKRSAEADEYFLFQCFIDHPSFSVLKDMDSPKCFASGRTGTGKTAFLKMIEKQADYSTEIDLQEMSLDYVSNSNIIRFLVSLNVDLDLFFQALWKHVLCIEYIRIKYSVDTETKSRRFYSSIQNFFVDNNRKKKALEYLREWESKFWITMDENIKEVTQKVEGKLEAEFSADIEKFRTRAGATRTMSTEKKAAIVARAKQIVDSAQLVNLNQVMSLLIEFDNNQTQKKYYLLIDKIDEKWVDESIRFKLIKALIETVKSFRKIRDCKTVIALRSDVLERAIQETSFAGEQIDKLHDYFQRIIWPKHLIEELIKKRISYLFRRQYNSENVHFEDVFPHKVGGKQPMEYILERTLLRPRDAIIFINYCLQYALGQQEVRPDSIKRAEADYSALSLQSLGAEWQSAFPTLPKCLQFLSGRSPRFELSKVATKEVIDRLVLQIAQIEDAKHDPVWQAVDKYSQSNTIDDCINIAKIWLSQLYRIGAIGLKLDSETRTIYSHSDLQLIAPQLIPIDCKIHIHPILHRALNIGERNTRS